MKINLAKSAGFCFGVKRALDIAFKIVSSRADVLMLGDIVHNEDVIKRIEKSGMKKISRLSRGEGKTLLIRAHGTGITTINKAGRLGYNIIDATCPMVKEIHRIAKEMEKKGYKIIIIGDKKHDEVRGIIGQLKNRAIVIDGLSKAPQKQIRQLKKAAIVVQSTQNIERVVKIIEALKSRIKELKFFNTICRPTRIKQADAKKIPLENDIMLIIGSKTSANTKRLYEISKSLNKKSYWVQSKKEIRPQWFRGVKEIGVTAGASTPDWIIKEIIRHLHKITA